MKTRLVVLALGSALLSLPAIAQDTPQPAPTPVPEKKVCRSITPTGSIMGKRLCMTKTEWKRFNDQNQGNAEIGMSGRRLGAGKGEP
jgi:hypothetical protein